MHTGKDLRWTLNFAKDTEGQHYFVYLDGWVSAVYPTMASLLLALNDGELPWRAGEPPLHRLVYTETVGMLHSSLSRARQASEA